MLQPASASPEAVHRLFRSVGRLHPYGQVHGSCTPASLAQLLDELFMPEWIPDERANSSVPQQLTLINISHSSASYLLLKNCQGLFGSQLAPVKWRLMHLGARGLLAKTDLDWAGKAPWLLPPPPALEHLKKSFQVHLAGGLVMGARLAASIAKHCVYAELTHQWQLKHPLLPTAPEKNHQLIWPRQLCSNQDDAVFHRFIDFDPEDSISSSVYLMSWIILTIEIHLVTPWLSQIKACLTKHCSRKACRL